MIIRVPVIDQPRRPALPANTDYSLVEDHGSEMTVNATAAEPAALERWAAAQGYYTPEVVRSEQLWIALYQIDPAVFAAVEALVEASTPIRLATRAATVRRVSQTVAGLRDALQASGFTYVDDAWLDQLWRAAVQVET